MNPNRFFMPSYMGMRNVPMTSSMLGMTNSIPRSIGLFGKITNGIRSVSWGNLLNNANRTLNVVNQTIPLVRQVGPMFNNMKSMLKIAKAFGNETTVSRHIINNSIRNNNNNNNNSISEKSNSYQNENLVQKKEAESGTSPNFFV